jgi:SAM-dependent methyltransferase
MRSSAADEHPGVPFHRGGPGCGSMEALIGGKSTVGTFNVYEDARRAEAYAKLEFPGTYFLAFRDLPRIIGGQVRGSRALDFGCGTGRSTRFLRNLGFRVVGIDIAADMVRQARARDSAGDYRIIPDGNFGPLDNEVFDLILSAFSFDNIPTRDGKVRILRGLRDLLAKNGRFVNLVSSPEIYTHEWASFSTKDFPQNREAKSGDEVKIIITDSQDRRPVVDVVWSDEDYREVYRSAGLELLETHRPLAKDDEPYPWVNETRIAPWVIYALSRGRGAA